MANQTIKVVYAINHLLQGLLSFLKDQSKKAVIAKNVVAIALLFGCSSYTILKEIKPITHHIEKIRKIKNTKKDVIGRMAHTALDRRVTRETLSIASHVVKEIILQTPSIVFAAQRNWVGLQWYSTTVVVAFASVQGFKSLVEKERPDKSDRESFPSGHGTLSGLGAVYLNISQGFVVALPMYLGTIFVGSMRVLNKRHYPIDVIGGVFIGTILALYLKKLLIRIYLWVEKCSKCIERKLEAMLTEQQKGI